MDRLEAMTLLLDTLDAGSFSAAARHRGMPAATLTRKIGQLEHHLGAALFLRSTRRLTLTDAGAHYVAGARAVLSQVDDLEREAAGEYVEPTGRLVVSAPRMFGRLHVLPVVAAFLEQHPGISIDLRTADGNVDLLSGAADLAVRIGPLPDSSLIATRVGSMRAVLVASPALIERHGMPDHPDALAGFPGIALDIPLPMSGNPGASPRLTVSSAAAAVAAAEAGIGVARLLHYQAAEGLRAGRLRILLAAHEDEPAPVHILHPPLAQMPVKLRRFLDFAADRLRGVLAAAPPIDRPRAGSRTPA